MSREIRDRAEYEAGSKWFADWHREQPEYNAKAIDVDLLGYCPSCKDPLYLIEATRSSGRKCADVLEHLGEIVNVPVWVVYQQKDGSRPDEMYVHDRSTDTHHGWLKGHVVWEMLLQIRRAHTCPSYVINQEDRHAIWTAGVEYGKAQRVQIEIEDQVQARLHALANVYVQAAAKLPPHDVHQATVRARQVASCEGQKREAVPWPDEVDDW